MQRIEKDKIKELVLETLIAADIHSLPVDLNKIFSCYGWGLVSYDTARKRGIDVEQSDDACLKSVEFGEGQWSHVICYNEKHPPVRIRWSIAHEIGHIRLRHYIKQSVDQNDERDAHYFSEQLFMPVAVLARLGAKTAEDLTRFCRVSYTAAKNRLPDLDRHRKYYSMYGSTKRDKMFLRQFFID